MGSMLWKIIFLLLWIGGHSQQFINPALIILPESERSFEKWRNVINQQLQETGATFDLTSTLHNIFAALKSSSFRTAVAKNISQKCSQDSQFYVHNLYANQSLWALQMQESSAKLPTGLFGTNNVHADGLFDECLAVRAPGFDGQYCIVSFKPTAVDQSEILPSGSFSDNLEQQRGNLITIFQLLGLLGPDRVDPKVSVADANTYILPSTTFCLPSSCSAADLGQAVAELIGSYVISNYSLVTVTDEQYCFKESNIAICMYILQGWYLHVTKQSQTRLAKPLVVLGWTLSAAVGLAIVYGLTPYVDPSKVPEISTLLKMTYGPLHRTAWAFVIAWIIFACSRGYGGFVNRLLSWKGFLPLGRMTYCVYLIHYDFLCDYYSAMRKRFYYTLFEQFTVCFGLLVVTFGLAFLVSVTLEASFLNLEKLIFSSKSKSQPREEMTAPPADEKLNVVVKKSMRE